MAANLKVVDSFNLFTFFMAHQKELGILAWLLPVAGQLVATKSWVALGTSVLEAGRQIAALELADDVTRTNFKTAVEALMPWWITSFVSKDKLDQLLDSLFKEVMVPAAT
jgi:hypothetical protein